jgi:hypothetical protein
VVRPIPITVHEPANVDDPICLHADFFQKNCNVCPPGASILIEQGQSVNGGLSELSHLEPLLFVFTYKLHRAGVFHFFCVKYVFPCIDSSALLWY